MLLFVMQCVDSACRNLQIVTLNRPFKWKFLVNCFLISFEVFLKLVSIRTLLSTHRKILFFYLNCCFLFLTTFEKKTCMQWVFKWTLKSIRTIISIILSLDLWTSHIIRKLNFPYLCHWKNYSVTFVLCHHLNFMLASIFVATIWAVLPSRWLHCWTFLSS